MKRFACIGTVLLAALAPTCLNDRDSLAIEARYLPGLAETSVGRFDRNPPLYYSMRVDRLQKQANLSLSEYDDLGVALDRLGRDDEAIAVMARKRQALDALTQNPQRKAPVSLDNEPTYTYHANLGTFLVHRWVRQGAKSESIDQLEGARAHIAKAVKINPGAHFGRENAQLYVMDWLLDLKTNRTQNSLGSWLIQNDHTGREIVRGLTGLIVLGSAWESIDVYRAIEKLLLKIGDPELATFVDYRVQELLADGKKPIVDEHVALHEVPPERAKIIRETRLAWHENAEQFMANRLTYMETRLKAGSHPDTDRQFWADYKETPAPRWPQVPFLQNPTNQFYLLIAGFLGFLVFVVTLYTRAQRRAKLATP